MNWQPLLGILLIVYAAFVLFVAMKKPKSVWEIAKVEGFRKVLGEKGTVIFFILWGLLTGGLGMWLLTL